MESRDPAGGGFVATLPVKPTLSAAWQAFSLHELEPPPQATVFPSEHVLALHISGSGRLRRRIGGESIEGRFGPGDINFLPAGVESEWDGSGGARAIVLTIHPQFLSRVISEGWNVDPRVVDMPGQFLVRDAVLESIIRRLAREVGGQSAGRSLYAQSACEFIGYHLVHAYSASPRQPVRFVGGLQRHRLKAVIDYIDANLAQPLSLHDLAALAGVSARHFERAFRQAMHIPAHAYVLQQRAGTARHLLLTERSLNVAEIARRVGFSSASHMATASRKTFGQSPASFRRHDAEAVNWGNGRA